MQPRVLAAAAAVTLALLAVAVAPAAATSRTGLIVVKKTIRLKFPAPGLYKGGLGIVEFKLRRNATRRNHSAGFLEQKKAKNKAVDFCEDQIEKMPVKVLHLSKPPFLIGTDKPNNSWRYSVRGPEPPKGDPVKAFQLGVSKLFRTGKKIRYRWRAQCKGTQVTKPYPY